MLGGGGGGPPGPLAGFLTVLVRAGTGGWSAVPGAGEADGAGVADAGSMAGTAFFSASFSRMVVSVGNFLPTSSRLISDISPLTAVREPTKFGWPVLLHNC